MDRQIIYILHYDTHLQIVDKLKPLGIKMILIRLIPGASLTVLVVCLFPMDMPVLME